MRRGEAVTGGVACTRRAFVTAVGAGAAGGLLAGCASGASSSDGGSAASAGGSVAADVGSSSSSSSDAVGEQSTTLFCFDTVVQLSALCSEELMDEAAARCEFFENAFSRTVEDSDVWNINHAGGEPVEVEPETAEVIEEALAFAEETDGLFDITIGAVSQLWDFDLGVKPDDAEIEEALAHVGWQGVSVEGTTVTLADPEAALDLGGIAKGYIADDLAGLFREGGCESACLSLGGNVYVLGASFDGDAWNVGVQDPNREAEEVIATVEVEDASVVTSGLYERSFELDGTTYHHILDPATGYPVETDLASASVVSESSLDGDACSTILFLLGHDAALELLDGDDRLEGLLVDASGEVALSQGATFELVEG